MKNLKLFLPFALLVFFSTAQAITVKGKLPTGDDAATAASMLPVTSTSGGQNATSSLVTSTSSTFELKASEKKARLFLTRNNATLPVLLGVLKGKKVYTYKKAVKKKICDDDDAYALMVIKKNAKKKNKLIFDLSQVSNTDAFYYLKRIVKVKTSKLKKYLDKTITASINDDCSPEGNAATLGIGSSTNSSSIGALDTDGDADDDGLADEIDADDDGDGIPDNYDFDHQQSDSSFWQFANLKVGIEQTVNVNAMPSPTPSTSQIDTLVGSTSLAMEVVADSSVGESSELNCGSLTYCSAGGTGKAGDPLADFPGVAGGTYDPDSDGFGTIEPGNTGDFQLQTNASAASAINAGDTFIQIVTASDSTETEYASVLGPIFKLTPAIKSLTDQASSPNTYTISYPVANGGQGTNGNCFDVDVNGSGDVVLRIVAWGPQRPGLPALGEADWVDIGHSLITIDIPNGPQTSGGGGGGSSSQGPGNCPASSYAVVSANLLAPGSGPSGAPNDAIYHNVADSDADPANTITFDVNITDCLAKDGSTDTLDVGEELAIDLQFKNSVGDNAAQKFCIGRS